MRLEGNRLILTVGEVEVLCQSLHNEVVRKTGRNIVTSSRQEITVELPLDSAIFSAWGDFHDAYMVSGTNLKNYGDEYARKGGFGYTHSSGQEKHMATFGGKTPVDQLGMDEVIPAPLVKGPIEYDHEHNVDRWVPVPAQTSEEATAAEYAELRGPELVEPVITPMPEPAIQDPTIPFDWSQVEMSGAATNGLTFEEVQRVSKLRSARWHDTPEKQWSTLEFAGAMAGEAGEAANVAKKIKRHDCGMTQKKIRKDRGALVFGLGQELADTVLYAFCVANQEGIDLATFIVRTFNEVSDREGFPERL